MSREETIAIIGLGQIGGSLALALRQANYFHQIIGYDCNANRLQLAAKFLHHCGNDLDDTLTQGDVILLATPVQEIERLLIYGFKHHPEKFYTDVGSVKTAIWLSQAKWPRRRYIGGHPLAGSEKEGEKGWDATLFRNKNYYIVQTTNQTKQDEEILLGMIRAIGAVPVIISPTKHDRAMAATSHLPLLLSLALMEIFVPRANLLKPFVGTGFRSLTRLTGGSPVMGKDLLLCNRDNLFLELDLFLAKIAELKHHLKNNDETMLLQFLQECQQHYWQQVDLEQSKNKKLAEKT